MMRPVLNRLRGQLNNPRRLRERIESAVMIGGTFFVGGLMVGEGLKYWSHHQMAQRMPKTPQEREELRQQLQQDFAVLRRAHPSIPNYKIYLEEEPSFGASARPYDQSIRITPPVVQNLTQPERMSILAHEANHLMSGHDVYSPNRYQHEFEADVFACKALNAMGIDGRQTFKTGLEKASQLEGGPMMRLTFWHRENETHPSLAARYEHLLKNCPPPPAAPARTNPPSRPEGSKGKVPSSTSTTLRQPNATAAP
jgi:Zn-dependent protease with chaperone function